MFDNFLSLFVFIVLSFIHLSVDAILALLGSIYLKCITLQIKSLFDVNHTYLLCMEDHIVYNLKLLVLFHVTSAESSLLAFPMPVYSCNFWAHRFSKHTYPHWIDLLFSHKQTLRYPFHRLPSHFLSNSHLQSCFKLCS